MAPPDAGKKCASFVDSGVRLAARSRELPNHIDVDRVTEICNRISCRISSASYDVADIVDYASDDEVFHIPWMILLLSCM